jgi:hypothetical protein
MFNSKSTLSFTAFASAIIAIITGLWVYVISDNPISVILSVIIGLCCGIVSFFVFGYKNLNVRITVANYPIKKIFVILFILFLSSYFCSSGNTVFSNWFYLPLLSWISFALSLVFVLFVPGFIFLNLIGGQQKMSLLVSVILSVLLSMFFTSIFWFIAKLLSLNDVFSFGFFSLAQFILLSLYYVRTNVNDRAKKQTKILSLNVIFPLAAVICIFVSLIVLQEFVYAPFIRGDSWDYVSTSLAITKGGFNLVSAGKFYSLNSPNFFETFLSALGRFSGFPPVNSLLILSLVVGVLLPVAFYVMSTKYTKNSKIGLLSTLLFVIASGFGWIPFVSEKLASISTYSSIGLVYAIDNLAPKVIYDITQPHGVLSEGLKTYAFGVLAVIMLLYLFKSELEVKARIPLIALLVGFAFQYHVEEAIIFALAFIPVYLVLAILSKGERKTIRYNLGGVTCGLLIALLISFISNHSNVVSSVSLDLASIAAMGVFFAFTYLKVNSLGSLLKSFACKFKLGIFLVVFYLVGLLAFVLVFYGYPGMSSDYSVAVVFQGSPFPWYYYPMSLGVMGLLIIIGLLMDFEGDREITGFLLIVLSLMVFGVILSWFNANVLLTGAKEWRVIYRVIPIPASVFGGWVLFRLVELRDRRFAVKVFPSRVLPKLRVNLHLLVPIVLLLVIILGIPSTVIASEYWMATSLNPNGDIHPGAVDVELSNFFFHLPLTDRAAVFSFGSNALVRLGGVTTAIQNAYPNPTDLTRPETVGLLSSDIRYIVLDKSSGTTEDFPMLSYLQVVFNNSKYVVYRLPYLQSSASESKIGYVAPIFYDNSSLLSYMLISSQNISYQVVYNDFFNKSILILPHDLSANLQGYPEKSDSQDPQVMFNWVNEGGHLVVFGGNGDIFKSLFATSDVSSYSRANSVSIGSTIYGLNGTVDVNCWSFDTDKIKVLSYYQLDGDNVCPFAVEKHVGNGSIVYFNVDPLYAAANQLYDTLPFADISSVINGSLNNLGLNVIQINAESAPISNRWLSEYKSYAENSFSAVGDITVQSSISGAYVLSNRTAVKSLTLDQVEVQNGSNAVLTNIIVEGQANVEINSAQLSSSNELLIPNYFSIDFDNCSVDIRSMNEGLLKIESDKGTFVVNETSFTSNNASFIVHSPFISVNGTAHFSRISLPSVGSVWSDNVDLQGETKFHVAYGDAQYIFFDNFSFPLWQPSTPEIAAIPLKDILLSPFNITFLILLGAIYLASSKRYFNLSETTTKT